jgi:hypothetical protein
MRGIFFQEKTFVEIKTKNKPIVIKNYNNKQLRKEIFLQQGMARSRARSL